MAAYTSLLVLMVLCIASAVSLKCYTCGSEFSNANCTTVATCAANQSFCMTEITGFAAYKVIIKNCNADCQPINFSFIAAVKTSCCSTDLCNVSGASSIKSKYNVLAVALGFLGALMRRSI
ncbi:lymphocyte antigen 6E-like [Rana temporaria]|uniref:lymphocyte antigen 6E-like n=1 Tax=Rana temporaria TaxID=8407 RepID=UPI001AAC8301|nr:lymphocyte antigen 6E-like [Rana temporaria]